MEFGIVEYVLKVAGKINLCCRGSIKDEKHTLTQLHKILYHVSLSYDAFHIRAKEASLALALRLVHLLHHEIQEGMLNITVIFLDVMTYQALGGMLPMPTTLTTPFSCSFN
jgi:hypothetical protein